MRSIIITTGSALAICALVACGAPQESAQDPSESLAPPAQAEELTEAPIQLELPDVAAPTAGDQEEDE